MREKCTVFNILIKLILVICIAGATVSAYRIYTIQHEYEIGINVYEKLKAKAVKENSKRKGWEKSIEKEDRIAQERSSENVSSTEFGRLKDSTLLQPPIEVDFDYLKAVSENIIGWIYAEAVPQISYPILLGKDNDYYLNKTFEEFKNSAGSIFLHCDNSSDMSDCNSIIYGHNMRNGTMFGSLKQYRLKETWETSPYIWIMQEQVNFRYEVFAVYITQKNGAIYTLFDKPDKMYTDYLKLVKEKSEIDSSVYFTKCSRIITLSTCTGEDNTRLVVQAVLKYAGAV